MAGTNAAFRHHNMGESSMAKIYQSAIIPASISEVWPVIGDFGGIHNWHPAIANATLGDGAPADQVGATRVCELGDGAKLTEKQIARSDEDHFYSYAITESPMPMSNYEGTMRLRPLTATGETFMEWSATFDPAAGAEADLPPMIEGLFQAGFEAVRARFGGS
jgi:hypothetical protein